MHYIWKEWKENIKGKGLWLSFGIIILVSVGLLFKSFTLSFDQGFYVLLINLFDAFVYFLPLLCLFLGAFSIFQEKEQKTLIMLLTRRDSFTSFLFKKSLAVHSMLIVPIFLWFFVYLIPAKFFFQVDLKSYFAFLVSIICIIVVYTQIGLLIGSISRSRMQIVGFTIGIWFYFFFIHDFILMSFLPDISYENVKLFSAVYFLNPIQAARMFLESSLGVYSFDHMSKLLKSFMWLKPGVFLLANGSILLVVSFIIAIIFHRKEGSE
ncbi:ABC-2 type transport system permease protein [Cytobacillus eiseniae]|uniref:ABC-2 type transport system permease protein n=1 Tax=Cytobacillus eiseniae TaxID=762947 RepID=A0ABS4RJZ4_9BACI|nr:ABC transporter permease subunit [Cytobacillus eiseniae]MBP2243230.1 ABC-2 type transport system permease protein [Cytobacillus eiseniae]